MTNLNEKLETLERTLENKDNGTKARGTKATTPPINPITTIKKITKGMSANIKRVVDVIKFLTNSNCLICDANVPTELGLASILTESIFEKNTPASSISINLQALSIMLLRICFVINSKEIANRAPTVITISV